MTQTERGGYSDKSEKKYRIKLNTEQIQLVLEKYTDKLTDKIILKTLFIYIYIYIYILYISIQLSAPQYTLYCIYTHQWDILNRNKS